MEHQEKVENLNFQIEEAKAQLLTQTQKKKTIERRVKKFINWLKTEQKIYVENIFRKLGFEDVPKKKNRRVSSVIQSRDHFNDTKNSTQLFRNVYNGNKSESELVPGLKLHSSNNRYPRSLVSPEGVNSRQSSHLNVSNFTTNLPEMPTPHDKAMEYINLRRDLKKETELVSKLRKLMMDTTHPNKYEYKSWPLVKHVWRWVKDLVRQSMESTQTVYIK